MIRIYSHNSNIESLNFENTASREETYFWWYLFALMEAGLIRSVVYQPAPITICPPKSIGYRMQGHHKPLIKSMSLLRELEYTPDFLIYWSDEAIGFFCLDIFSINHIILNNSLQRMPFFCIHDYDFDEDNSSNVSTIDVKGTFSRHGQKSDTIFSIIQKVLYDGYGLYVQKVIPIKLFQQTFTPMRYLYHDKAMGKRKLNYEARTLKQYIHNLQSIIYDKDPQNIIYDYFKESNHNDTGEIGGGTHSP